MECVRNIVGRRVMLTVATRGIRVCVFMGVAPKKRGGKGAPTGACGREHDKPCGSANKLRLK